MGAPQPAGWPAADAGVWGDLPSMEDGEAEVARAAAAAEREERERQAMRSLFVQLAGRADNAVYKSEEWAVLSKVVHRRGPVLRIIECRTA